VKNPLRTERERIARDVDAMRHFDALLREALKANDPEAAIYILDTRVPKLESHVARFFARFNGSYRRVAELRRHLLTVHLPRKPT